MSDISNDKFTGQIIDIKIQGKYYNHIQSCPDCKKFFNRILNNSAELSKQIAAHLKHV